MSGVCTGPGPCDTSPTGTGDNWVTRAGGLPPYVRALVNAFKRKGVPESIAVSRAIGVLRDWAEGKGGVTAATRTRAAAAIAQWEALRAKAHALTAAPATTVDLAGPRGYSHGWLRLSAAEPTAVERATRAVVTDGHAMLHGPGMVEAAQRVVERVKAAGHTPQVRRVDVAGAPHVHIARAAMMSMTATSAQTVDLTFTESLHPRTPKGSTGGGRFAGKNSAPEANGSAATMRAQTRDFQRRTGLAQTGRLDAATQAKIKKVEAPKVGGGKGKRKAAKTAAASHAAHRAAATATAINRLSTMQRAKYRILRPTPPPGYHWTHDNRLVKSTAQSRAVRRILTGK